MMRTSTTVAGRQGGSYLRKNKTLSLSSPVCFKHTMVSEQVCMGQSTIMSRILNILSLFYRAPVKGNLFVARIFPFFFAMSLTKWVHYAYVQFFFLLFTFNTLHSFVSLRQNGVWQALETSYSYNFIAWDSVMIKLLPLTSDEWLCLSCLRQLRTRWDWGSWAKIKRNKHVCCCHPGGITGKVMRCNLNRS